MKNPEKKSITPLLPHFLSIIPATLALLGYMFSAAAFMAVYIYIFKPFSKKWGEKYERLEWGAIIFFIVGAISYLLW